MRRTSFALSTIAGLCGTACYGVPTHKAPAKPVKAPAPRIVGIRIEPPTVQLIGTRSEAHYVVTARLTDGTLEDVTDRAVVKLGDVRLARLSADHTLYPLQDGDSKLVASFGASTASAVLHVKDSKTATAIEFSREIVPILTRAGCNQGICHGSQYGKGGFKISLSGFDPDVDYYAIVKQSGGRRTRITDPDKSLVLRKPGLRLAHLGGLRLAPNSPDYLRMAAWIRQGAPGPKPKDPVVTRIEVYPKERVFSPGKRQNLVVLAEYSDGMVRDVTSWARFGTLNDAVASASLAGQVKAVGRGETSIMVRFGGQATVARMAVPFAKLVAYPNLPEQNFIDGLIARKWKTLGLLPSRLCDDSTFLRRVMLDVIGTPPTAEEAKEFLADPSPDKRAKLIDKILERPEYADYWTLKWGDLLRSNRNTLSPKGMWSLTNWIRAQFRDNRPLDQFAQELVTAQGSTFTTGPANYYRVANNPQDLAETTAQVFLGMRLQCVKCHHHPFEKWSQKDYYQFAAYFARVGQKSSQEFGIFGNEQVVRINNGGEVYHPKTGQKMTPAPLGGYPERMQVHDVKTAALIDPDPDKTGDRRVLLADWIVRDNPLFARNIANRYWGYMMGRGLVEPIDDQRITNPPTNPELLDALSKDFESHGYDVKRLIRTICSSRAYQLDSEPTTANLPDTTFYTHYLVKRLPAEALFDALNQAAGTPEKFNELPLGTRAIQLPDPNVSSYFLDTFGRAPRIIACECERAPEPNMGQALHLMMGDMMNRKVQDDKGLPARLIAAKKTDDEIFDTFYFTALGRAPRTDEKYKAESIVRQAADRQAMIPAKRWLFLNPTPFVRSQDARDRDRRHAMEDIYWALLNCKEFIFNH